MRQGRILHVVLYQDDFFAVMLGEEAAPDTEKGFQKLVPEELGVQISEKEEVNKPFVNKLGAFGAAYDIGDLSRPRSGPKDSFRSKLTDAANKIERWKGKKAHKKGVQKFVRLLQFTTEFSKDGAFWCNSGYACLADNTKGSKEESFKLAPITAEFAEDAGK